MTNQRKKLRIGFSFFIIVILFLYGLFQSKNLLEGPKISITEPENGETLTQDLVSVKGIAKNIAYIKLNDRQIFINDKGEFDEKILVQPGYSIIKIFGTDKFGKTQERFIHVYLPENIIPNLEPAPLPDIDISTSTASSTLEQQI